MSNVNSPGIIHYILAQHCEDAAFLWTLRQHYLVRADIGLADLASLDERIDAHLDGIRVSAEPGRAACLAALANANAGAVFTAATLALEAKRLDAASPLFALAEAQPQLASALIGALSWATPQDLRGTVKSLLVAPSAFQIRIGIAACAAHRVGLGAFLREACEHADVALACCALRTAGELGQTELLPVCLIHMDSPDPQRAVWAAWSAVLLGDRGQALEKLAHFAKLSALLKPALHRQAFQLALRVIDPTRGHRLLEELDRDPIHTRLLIEGAGILGDSRYAGWLIKQMQQPGLARLAGEALSSITGLDLKRERLYRLAAEEEGVGPSDDPTDESVAMDVDESLPWPDVPKLTTWWQDHGVLFAPGSRLFAGAPPTAGHCLQVLREQPQRRRVAAAMHLALLKPGSVLFDCGAPSWRQQHLLEQMVA